MTLDCTGLTEFIAVKGHSSEFLISSILGYLAFFRFGRWITALPVSDTQD